MSVSECSSGEAWNTPLATPYDMTLPITRSTTERKPFCLLFHRAGFELSGTHGRVVAAVPQEPLAAGQQGFVSFRFVSFLFGWVSPQ